MKRVSLSEELHSQVKKAAAIEKKSIKSLVSEAIINNLAGKEFLNKVDLKDIYKFIIMEYIDKTKHIIQADSEAKGESLDLDYLMELQKKFFEAKIEVYKHILEAIENNKVPQSITEIVDFSTDEDPVLMGKISAIKEIKYELNRLLSAFNL